MFNCIRSCREKFKERCRRCCQLDYSSDEKSNESARMRKTRNLRTYSVSFISSLTVSFIYLFEGIWCFAPGHQFWVWRKTHSYMSHGIFITLGAFPFLALSDLTCIPCNHQNHFRSHDFLLIRTRKRKWSYFDAQSICHSSKWCQLLFKHLFGMSNATSLLTVFFLILSASVKWFSFRTVLGDG